MLLHWSAGETLPPAQPNPLRMNWLAKTPVGARSGLVKVNTGVCAPLLPQPEIDAAETANTADKASSPYLVVPHLLVLNFMVPQFMVHSLLQVDSVALRRTEKLIW